MHSGSVIFKLTPANDTGLPNGPSPLPSGWSRINYVYAKTSADIEIELSSVSSLVVYFEPECLTSVTLTEKVKNLDSITLGDVKFGSSLGLFEIAPDLRAKYPGISDSEINCEFFNRLHKSQPGLSLLQIKNWAKQIVGPINYDIFSNPPDFSVNTIPPPTPSVKVYNLFAPENTGIKEQLTLKFFTSDNVEITNLKSTEFQKYNRGLDFSRISGQYLKLDIRPETMYPLDSGFYVQNAIVQDTNLKVKKELQFNVSFIEKLEIKAGTLLNKGLYPGIANKQLRGIIKFRNQEKEYDIYDPEVSARLGVSGSLFSWSTSGNLISVNSSGVLSVPQNSLFPSTGTFIPNFTDLVYNDATKKSQSVKLTLNSNYVTSTDVTFSILPSLKWLPVFFNKAETSGITDFSSKLQSAKSALSGTKDTLKTVQKVLPLLGIFESLTPDSVFSVLLTSVIDTVISLGNLGFYWAILNPLDEKSLVERGYLSGAAISSKERRTKEIAGKVKNITDDVIVSPIAYINNLIQSLSSGTEAKNANAYSYGSLASGVTRETSTAGTLAYKKWIATNSYEFTSTPVFSEFELTEWESFVKKGVEFYPLKTERKLSQGIPQSLDKVVSYLESFGISVVRCSDSSLTTDILNESNKDPINDKLLDFYDSFTYSESKLYSSGIENSQTNYKSSSDAKKFSRKFVSKNGLVRVARNLIPDNEYMLDIPNRNRLLTVGTMQDTNTSGIA